MYAIIYAIYDGTARHGTAPTSLPLVRQRRPGLVAVPVYGRPHRLLAAGTLVFATRSRGQNGREKSGLAGLDLRESAGIFIYLYPELLFVPLLRFLPQASKSLVYGGWRTSRAFRAPGRRCALHAPAVPRKSHMARGVRQG